MDLSNFEVQGREEAKLLMLLKGPAGSGKTFTALRIAHGLSIYMREKGIKADPRVGVIDTEHKRSLYYRGNKVLGGMVRDPKSGLPTPAFPFSVKAITGTFSPRDYVTAMKIAQRNGIDILIIDSLTHAWAGRGGMLEHHDRVAEKSKNSYTAWKPVDDEYNLFMDAILDFPGHVISTVRAKEAHELQPTEVNGKVVLKPERIGLKPIFREGVRGSLYYEFALAFSIDQRTHKATVEKDITGVFEDPEKPATWGPELLTQEHGRVLAEYFYGARMVGAEMDESAGDAAAIAAEVDQQMARRAADDAARHRPAGFVTGPQNDDASGGGFGQTEPELFDEPTVDDVLGAQAAQQAVSAGRAAEEATASPAPARDPATRAQAQVEARNAAYHARAAQKDEPLEEDSLFDE